MPDWLKQGIVIGRMKMLNITTVKYVLIGLKQYSFR
jgi:hypothetical protein